MNAKAKTLVLLLILLVVLAAAVTGYRALSGTYAPKEDPAVGGEMDAATDFRYFDADGDEHRLADLFGKPIVVNFWASWCNPCRAEMAAFDDAYAAYGDDVTFLMVNLTDGQRETEETATAFIKESGYAFPIYFDGEASGIRAYGVNSIPRTLFIDADGNIYHDHVGAIDAATLDSTVEAITK